MTSPRVNTKGVPWVGVCRRALRSARGVSDEATARALKDIGRRIAEARAERGLTQEAFAEQVLGVSLKYLQHLEAGRENLTVASLVSLAERIGWPLPALFEPPRSREVRRGRPPSRSPATR
jgi:DNA-binding XRE family transcriptional regulator